MMALKRNKFFNISQFLLQRGRGHVNYNLTLDDVVKSKIFAFLRECFVFGVWLFNKLVCQHIFEPKH